MTNDTVSLRGKQITEKFIHVFRFAIFTGLRPGELFELKPSDIIGNTIDVNGSLNTFLEHTSGKNENAQRSFILNEYALRALRDQRKLLMSKGIRSEYVFCDVYGSQIVPLNYYRHWVKYRKHYGLEKASPYELRHIYVADSKSSGRNY